MPHPSPAPAYASSPRRRWRCAAVAPLLIALCAPLVAIAESGEGHPRETDNQGVPLPPIPPGRPGAPVQPGTQPGAQPGVPSGPGAAPAPAPVTIQPPPPIPDIDGAKIDIQTKVSGWYRHQPLREVLEHLSKQIKAPITVSAEPAAVAALDKPITWHGSDPVWAVLYVIGEQLGLRPNASPKGTVFQMQVNPYAQELPPLWITDRNPVKIASTGGQYQLRPPPNGWTDPVDALGDGDEASILGAPAAVAGGDKPDAPEKPSSAKTAKVAKAPKFNAKAFIDGYVDRIEAWHVEHSAPPAALLAFFKAHPDIRRDFWQALSPRFDDAKAALAVFESLRAASEKRLIENKHLAIAISVVFDSPDAPVSSRAMYLWSVTAAQFAPSMSALEIFDYFTDPANQALFVFKPKDLVWPLMVHLVDFDLTKPEIAWARKTYGKSLDPQALYSQVPYDFDKLTKHPKLGDRPYTLENLRTYGGVCVDQAHFSSRIAKAFGIPAVKCAGSGRYGGAGHSWTGFLTADKKTRAPILDFTGRYNYDFYYTGTIFDPQTRCETLDRSVALMYEGVAGGKYQDYIDASALTRAALKLETAHPALAAALAKEAANHDAFVADTWRVLMRLSGTGALSDKDADQAYHKMLAALGTRHPDICLEALTIYLGGMEESKRDLRQTLYQEAYAVFGAAKRPDLQIRMRLDQLEELSYAGKSKQVIALAFETVSANAQEGALVMPLVKQVVELSKGFKATDKTFQIQVVKDGLKKIAADFPKQRGNDVSQAWMEYEQLMNSL